MNLIPKNSSGSIIIQPKNNSNTSTQNSSQWYLNIPLVSWYLRAYPSVLSVIEFLILAGYFISLQLH
ncbi:TPA: BC10 family protein [Klebsiella pneumoniae]|nr:BC10 family protein [Klebsiella pneumoniae]HBT8980322.1 BC10 family protein [Klebsiella pneumoniae]